MKHLTFEFTPRLRCWRLGREPREWFDRAAWIIFLGPFCLWWDRGPDEEDDANNRA